jgi:hypothetical protein
MTKSHDSDSSSGKWDGLAFCGLFIGIGFLASGRSDLKVAGICLTAICGFFWFLSLVRFFSALAAAKYIVNKLEEEDTLVKAQKNADSSDRMLEMKAQMERMLRGKSSKA